MSKRKAVAKRGRTRGDTSPNIPTFFSEEAENLMAQLATRDGIRERGFDLHYSTICDLIQARNWRTFTTQPEAALMPLVREFYANARARFRVKPHEMRSLVRGKNIMFDSSTINQLFDLHDYEEDDYTAWVRSGPDYEVVINTLTESRGMWKKQNEKYISFPRGGLEVYSKAWHYFISARLLPTNHVSDVTKERALLNYAIQTGLTIDVGRIIEQSIVSIITGRLSGSLGHPSLICQLCFKAGVSPIVVEDVQHPLPVINHAVLEGFKRTSTSHPESHGMPPRPTASTSSRQESRKTKGKAQSNEELSERIDKVDLRVKRLMRRQMQQYEHMVQLFHSCNIPHGDLPQGPTFSDISDDTEEDIDDEASE